MGNACAHHVFNSLFWCGEGDMLSWADVTEVRAELYRAHDVQGTDTTFVIATTSSGVPIRMTISHACVAEDKIQEEVVRCENATITYSCGSESRAVGSSISDSHELKCSCNPVWAFAVRLLRICSGLAS